MLAHLLLFEGKYHVRQFTFLLAGVLFLGLGIMIAQGNFGSGDLHRNAPYVISYITCIISLLTIFVSTLFTAQVVLRDTTYDMNALLFTTTLRRLPYFAVRLLGLVLAVLLVLALGVAGVFLGTSGADPDTLGPFRWQYFVQPLLIIGLPNILFCCSIIFAVALLTRQVRAVYIAGVGLFILYFLGSILGNSPLMANSALKSHEAALLPNLLDPFGITSFFGLTRHWTVDERNQRLLLLTGYFLLNRLVWLTAAGLILLFTWRRFAFRLPVTHDVRKKHRPYKVATPAPFAYHPVTTRPATNSYPFRAFLTQWRLETNAILRHVPFLVLLALWAFLTAVDLQETILHGPYNIRFYTASGYIVDYLRPMRPALLLIVFYAGELLYRERGAKMHELVFATPVSNTVLWCAKAAGLASLIASLVAVNIITGIGFQLVQGYQPVEWTLYLSLFYYSGWPLSLYTILILFVQSLCRNKFVGMLLSLAVAGLFLFGNRLGLHSYLLRYAATPLPEYAYMSGWGHEGQAVHWYQLYWTAIAIILLVLGAAAWQARSKVTFRLVMRLPSSFLISPRAIILYTCLMTSLGIAGYVRFKPGNTAPVASALQTWKAAYEKQYRTRASVPQPVVTQVQLATDLYPAEGRYTVKGQYRLRNASATPIPYLWLGSDIAVSKIHYDVPGAGLTIEDDDSRLSRYTLRQPLQPGDSMTLSFTLEVIQSPFSPFNSENAVVPNGSYVELDKYLPYLGYNASYELDDHQLRKKLGLPPAAPKASTDSSYHLVTMDHILSTEADQQVVCAGDLQRSWTSQGRRYFHYQANQPTAFRVAFSSARYALHQEMHDGVTLNIWYQPGLSHNVTVIAQAMADALDYGNRNWGPYPFRQLTLAAIPHYPGAATAYPGVLFSAERINFMSNLTDTSRFNSVYAVTAHEVAHQWWANVLTPLGAPGRAVLTESLARYGEYMTIEKRFGAGYLRRLLQADNNLYFALRGMDHEQELPLYRSDQPYVYYQKGGLVMYGIKEMLGETTVNTTLRKLIHQYGNTATKGRPDDLLRLLNMGATPQQAAQITSWFTNIVTYDNAITAVRCDSLRGGRYRLVVDIDHGKNLHGQAAERLKTLPVLTSIAVYATPPGEWNKATMPLHQQYYPLTGQRQTITIEVADRPTVVMLDPLQFLLDADLSDNQYMIKSTR